MLEQRNIPRGVCQCGCGLPTRLARQTSTKYGWVRGEPLKYRLGHARKGKHTFAHTIDEATGCWVWDGCKSPTGYAVITVDGVSINASRYSYRMFIGEIPDGFQVDHLCRNRACVNPAHLEAVTPRVNAVRRPATKLKDEDVALVLAWQGRMRQVDIARHFGVDQSTISHIVTGKRRRPD